MIRHWTFGQKVGAGLAVVVALTVTMGLIGVRALRQVVASKDEVIYGDAQLLIEVERLHAARERSGSATRGYLLTQNERFLDEARESRARMDTILNRLRGRLLSGEGRSLLEAVEQSASAHRDALDRVISMRRAGSPLDTVTRAFDEQVGPRREELDRNLQALVSRKEQLLEDATRGSSRTASEAIFFVIAIAVGTVLLGAVIAILLTRALSGEITTTVGQVQSSSAELQATANQQATGAREQATAMSEITTTISELLATSRQIAESTQQVAAMADQSARAAHAGGEIVEKAHESISGIRRQVDLVVDHMLELGRKSQHIGSVLDIVSELAEQTNILSINATIEAAGAGEAGRRFAVVADEIRKLADRVTDSTKEIRALIEDVRSAVNTTVMATETGSKAVESGSRQFGEVTSAFKQIGALVATTTEATKEIQLSTKQQATAVEQVNLAVANVAQTTRETEASSGQTLQTASQLASLSKNLLRLVRPRMAA